MDLRKICAGRRSSKLVNDFLLAELVHSCIAIRSSLLRFPGIQTLNCGGLCDSESDTPPWVFFMVFELYK